MKMFPEKSIGPRHPAFSEAVMAIGSLCAGHHPQRGLASLKAAYSAEEPGFRKRALLAAMIAHLANWQSHALHTNSPATVETEPVPAAPVEIEAPKIAISDIGAILKAPKKANPAKPSVFTVQLEDATRLLFASMDEDEDTPVHLNTTKLHAAEADLEPSFAEVESAASDVPPIIIEMPTVAPKKATAGQRKKRTGKASGTNSAGRVADGTSGLTILGTYSGPIRSEYVLVDFHTLGFVLTRGCGHHDDIFAHRGDAKIICQSGHRAENDTRADIPAGLS